MCKECLCKTEKGKVIWSHQDLKATNSGRREARRRSVKVCTASHSKWCGCLVRKESFAIDRDVQEELDMLQLNESIPYVRIDCIKKAIKAKSIKGEARRLVSVGSRQQFVGLGTGNSYSRGTLCERALTFRGGSSSRTTRFVSYVCPHCGLFARWALSLFCRCPLPLCSRPGGRLEQCS